MAADAPSTPKAPEMAHLGVRTPDGEPVNSPSSSRFPSDDYRTLDELRSSLQSPTLDTADQKRRIRSEKGPALKNSPAKRKRKLELGAGGAAPEGGRDRSNSIWNAIWSYVVGSEGQQQKSARRQHAAPSNGRSLKPLTETLPGDLDFVCALQISLWDNVYGPRILQVWQGDSAPVKPEEQISAARHTLNDEICRPDDESVLEPKFHVVPELGYVIASVIFIGHHNTSTCRHALSLFVPRESLHRFMTVQRVVENRMLHLGAKLKALLRKKQDTALGTFSTFLPAFLTNIGALYKSGLGEISFNDTLFGPRQNTAQFDHQFIALALTSHLQTHGSTIVTGPDAENVNMFIDTLALFVGEEERARSSRCRPENAYVADYFLQGLVNISSVPDETVIHSLLPTTLIDIGALTVMQTHCYHEYEVLRQEYMDSEIKQLMGAQAEHLWTAQDGLFKSIAKPAPYVVQLVIEVLRLPQPLRKPYIQQSMRLLMRKAVLLIRYVEAELRHAAMLQKEVGRQIRQDLGISDKADLAVLLGVAEKLRPGIYKELYGDPAAVEDQLKYLLESFI